MRNTYVTGSRTERQSANLGGDRAKTPASVPLQNRERIVEPHDYGIHHGLIKLFGYQVGGSSSQKLPNWRWAEQDLVSDIELLNRTFPGGRPTKSGKHHKWDKLFIQSQTS